MEDWIIALIIVIIGVALTLLGNFIDSDNIFFTGIIIGIISGIIFLIMGLATLNVKGNTKESVEYLTEEQNYIISLYNTIKDCEYNLTNAILFNTLQDKVNDYDAFKKEKIRLRENLNIDTSVFTDFPDIVYNPFNNTLYINGVLVE